MSQADQTHFRRVALVDPTHTIRAPGGHRQFSQDGETVDMRDSHWHQLIADGSIRFMTEAEIAEADKRAAAAAPAESAQ
jgi:transcriptional regulator of nitric oxide reductase